MTDAERERESSIQQGIAVGVDNCSNNITQFYYLLFRVSKLFLYLLSTKAASEVSSLMVIKFWG